MQNGIPEIPKGALKNGALQRKDRTPQRASLPRACYHRQDNVGGVVGRSP